MKSFRLIPCFLGLFCLVACQPYTQKRGQQEIIEDRNAVASMSDSAEVIEAKLELAESLWRYCMEFPSDSSDADYLFEAIGQFADCGEYTSALEAVDSFCRRHSHESRVPKVRYLEAHDIINHGLKDVPLAKQKYTAFLDEYPGSPLVLEVLHALERLP